MYNSYNQKISLNERSQSICVISYKYTSGIYKLALQKIYPLMPISFFLEFINGFKMPNILSTPDSHSKACAFTFPGLSPIFAKKSFRYGTVFKPAWKPVDITQLWYGLRVDWYMSVKQFVSSLLAFSRACLIEAEVNSKALYKHIG
jgi:hypothetical protein